MPKTLTLSLECGSIVFTPDLSNREQAGFGCRYALMIRHCFSFENIYLTKGFWQKTQGNI